MKSPARPNLPALTGLRFFLAFFVLMFHQTSPGNALGPEVLATRPYLQGFLRTGYVSVGFFFMLSGFVLAYGYDLSEDWCSRRRRQFWQARFARIYPVYFFALILTIPFAFQNLRHMRPQPSPLVALFLSLTALPLLQSWIPASTGVWNVPAWSLSDEAFFYLLFPFLGRFVWRLGRARGSLCLMATLWLANILITFTLARHVAPTLALMRAQDLPLSTPWINFIKYNPIMHLAEFAAGIATAKLYLETMQRPDRRPRPGSGFPLCGLALITEILMLTFADRVPYPILHNGLLLPLHAAIIIGLARGGPGLPRWLAYPQLVFLGQSSYALYLLHVTVWTWIIVISRHIFHSTSTQPAVFPVYAVFTVFMSCMVYAYLEEPARRYVLRYFASRRTPADTTTKAKESRATISAPVS